MAGFNLGKRIPIRTKKARKIVPVNSDSVYYIISFLTFIGVMKTFVTLFGLLGGVEIFFFNIFNGTANTFRHTLEEVYSPGIFSLRYLAIQASAVAVIRRLIFKKKSLLDYLNIMFLISIALISSRLSIIVFLLSTLILYLSYKRIRINMKKVLILGLSCFHLLGIFNYTRNINFYRDRGINDFYSAGFSEIMTYVGVAFQGAVSVGEKSYQILDDPQGWDNYAGIEKSLTANSALNSQFQLYGWWALVSTPILLLLLSFITGILSRFRHTYLYLSYATLIYAFAEFWRLFWFGTGIMITLTIMPIAIFLILFLLKSARDNA
ncbi:hypothetical protein E7Z59_08725 [Robertkochia marina]|uniref:O-antigen ligase domain-containing protein n=1 Tax=Robertkochia marina TaxID=1227945 RepID=A0A4S3M0L8_9FLAO|nr:hypothetical protein [Robertkochia marina]THD67728.1 hypothetical protein E7Z59_08725 [Robertkochia marina]